MRLAFDRPWWVRTEAKMVRCLATGVLVVGWLLVVGTSSVWGITYYVDSTCGDDSQSGHSADCDAPWPGGPKLTIGAALAEALEGDAIVVAAGTYSGASNRDMSFGGRAITISGQGGPGACVIDCEGMGRGFEFVDSEGSNSVLEGITIINGYRDVADLLGNDSSRPAGGGIFCRGGSPTIRDCAVQVCQVASTGVGGALACVDGANPTLIECEITGNHANLWGGGLYVNAGSSATLRDCVIRGNGVGVFGSGGGVYIDGGENTTQLEGCLISDNAATIVGGGIMTTGSDCEVVLENCVVSGNVAGEGGGVCVYDHGLMTVVNCTFSGNEATGGAVGRGGAGKCFDGELFISNSILWGNLAAANGAELSVAGTTGILAVSYSTVKGGELAVNVTGSGALTWGGGNLVGDPCFVRAGVRQMGQWQEGDYHLRLDSPCVDAGDPCGETSDVDIDGYARVVDGDGDGAAVVDMGADEVGVISSWHSATQCYGDVDGDGHVGTQDWPAFRDAFGANYPAGNYGVRGDFDRDGAVDTSDWTAFRDHFGWLAPQDCVYDGVWPPVN